MQAKYPKKLTPTSWDTLNINYPIRKFPETACSSETLARVWKPTPEILPALRTRLEQEDKYTRDYNATLDMLHSQTDRDYGYKIPEESRFNKHNSCNDNLYIYPPSRKLADRVPAEKAHGDTEMRSSYTKPETLCRAITNKNQFKNPISLRSEWPDVQHLHKDIEPLDTTYNGFEKYLDPYLTTNRLHHRPFTADVLSKISNSNNVQTYYTYSDIPWVRTQKPDKEEWRLPLSKAKSIYDRQKFKEGFREIRTHNRQNFIPRAFRTETRDNYIDQNFRPEARIHNYSEEVQSLYNRAIASLQTNTQEEKSAIKALYNTESSYIGSRTPICSVIEQYFEKNKKLESRERKQLQKHRM